jgi:hypothetical protein
MPYTLQQLADLEDIRMLKHRYFRAIDTANAELLAELFTDDVSVDYRGGNYRITLQGRDQMLEFLANSFNANVAAMHHGHMPEITLTGEDTAEGLWYLEDIFINLARKTHIFGSAIYKDRYRRVGGNWKIEHTEYDRVMEVSQPLSDQARLTSHHLATAGRRPEDMTDSSGVITITAARPR